jgi:mannan endo-1,4-beta-mannosidase
MKKLVILLAIVTSTVSTGRAENSVLQPDSRFKTFVYARGDKLMDETGEFRFISFNVPCLHNNEDNMPFAEMNPWRLPDEFEINDALESVRQMGGQVARIYTLSIRRPREDPNIPRHVTGAAQFNDEAYKSLDMTLAIANRKGIRIIFPFIDNARWWGGIDACAAFRGKTREDFWTDPNLFEDYKAIVNSVVNRTNSITGIKYRDDKAILAWETGNELICPPEWTVKAAAYIKSIDQNHLVMDGYHLTPVRDLSLQDKNIDIVTTHHYPIMFRVVISPAEMIEQIKKTAALARGKKAYVVGEFGFIPTKDVESLLQTVINEKISGVLIWSLRFHNRDGGFYSHSEPHGGDKYKAYHWPGFASGNAFDETNVLSLIRRKAFEITPPAVLHPTASQEAEGQAKRGGVRQQDAGAVPAIEKPAAPVLLETKDVAAISWQGSTGASDYTVERAESENGPWQIAGRDISDADFQYRPLFNDTSVKIGKSYYYRVTARNSSGKSKPSNIVGPVSVTCKTLVDELQNFKLISNRDGALSLETKEARKFKEDMHRLKGITGSSIIYKVEPPIVSWKVYSFFPVNIADFNFYVSADGQNFKPAKGRGLDVGSADGGPVKFSRRDYFTGKGDYNYCLPVLYTGTGIGDDTRYLKIEYNAEAQISRVEIKYGKHN